jgi:hypothetical protein
MKAIDKESLLNKKNVLALNQGKLLNHCMSLSLILYNDYIVIMWSVVQATKLEVPG